MSLFFIIFALVVFPSNLGAQETRGHVQQIGVQPLPRHQAPLVSIGVLVLNIAEQAEVYINNQFIGEAPLRDRFISLHPGSYNIVVKKEGYKSWVKKVEVPGNGEIHLSASLLRRTGILIIRPNIAGTDVFVDGVRKEISPLLEGIRFTPGEHTIRITKRGFFPWERTVVVWEDKKITVNPSLQQKPEEPHFREPSVERPQKRSRNEEDEIIIFPSF